MLTVEDIDNFVSLFLSLSPLSPSFLPSLLSHQHFLLVTPSLSSLWQGKNLQEVSISLVIHASGKHPDLSSYSLSHDFKDRRCNKDIFTPVRERELLF